MKQSTNQELPKARTAGLLVRELEDELLVYDLDDHRAHCLNKTAAMIWNLCDGKSSASQIATNISRMAGLPVPEELIWLGLANLQKTRLLNDGTARVNGAKTLTRRDVLRRLGVGAAVALPLVTSVFAPRASEAATCKTVSTPCTANAQCCSGTCVGCPGSCTVCT